MTTYATRSAFDRIRKIGEQLMIIFERDGITSLIGMEDYIVRANWEATQIVDGEEQRLTPLALDGGDSAASEQFPTPEVLSTLQGESTPAHRK